MLDSEPLVVTPDTSCKAQSMIMMDTISLGIFGLFVQCLDIVFVVAVLLMALIFGAYSVSRGCHAAVFATMAEVWTSGFFALLVTCKALETGI